MIASRSAVVISPVSGSPHNDPGSTPTLAGSLTSTATRSNLGSLMMPRNASRPVRPVPPWATRYVIAPLPVGPPTAAAVPPRWLVPDLSACCAHPAAPTTSLVTVTAVTLSHGQRVSQALLH